jgi:hypothetical protein
MKTPLLFFAAGALIVWFFKLPPEHGSGGKVEVEAKAPPGFMATKANDELAKQTARVQALEKEVNELKSGRARTDTTPSRTPFDEKRMEDLEKRQDEKDVNREVDRLTLRLKLMADQKLALRKFLTEGKEKQRTAFRATTGVLVESPSKGKEEFLKDLLTTEQQEEYARSVEDQRLSRAEEYAQRKVRKLNNELNLSEHQKDKLFQTYAQRKLEATDPTIKAEAGDTAPALQGVLPDAGGGDIDRKALELILTPGQLTVYDQRQKDENEKMGIVREENGMMIEEFAVSLPTGDDEEEDDEEDDGE